MKKVPTWVFLILVNGIVMISGFAFFIGETVYELKNTAVNQTFEFNKNNDITSGTYSLSGNKITFDFEKFVFVLFVFMINK